VGRRGVDLGPVEERVATLEEVQRAGAVERTDGGAAGRSGHGAVSLAEAAWAGRPCDAVAVHAPYFPRGTLTPAERTPPPRTIARICMNGHLAEDALAASVAGRVPTNRADPLAVRTTDVRCAVCGAGTILGCPGCGYPIPGRLAGMPYRVPHFCVVCGEYYPWTFRGEFYATLEEILAEAPDMPGGEDARGRALQLLGRQREGLASFEDMALLADAFRVLGGSDWDLAAQILRVVLPADTIRRLDLAARFSH
jgi:hypothetical protein